MTVSICIGSVRHHTLEFTVRSLQAQTVQDFEVVIVGQGPSAELTALGARLAAEDPRIRYVHLDRTGAARARNAAVVAASGDIIAFLDDDCEAAPTWLEEILAAFDADPSIGAIGGAVVAPDVTGRRFCACPAYDPAEVVYDPGLTWRQPPTGWGWIGANFAIRREVFLSVGSFDEQLGPGTRFPVAEDTDLLFRLEDAAVKMLSTPRPIVLHTYGARCGLRNRLRHSRNYAAGNAGLAAKLTLANDQRGPEWYTWAKEGPQVALRQARFGAAAAAVYRYYRFREAYRACLAGYVLDDATGHLRPIAS
jgi:GT2 family glycosyltransferase